VTEIERINEAIKQGRRVTGVALGHNRKGAPCEGALIKITQVIEDRYCGEYAVYSAGYYKGRIRVRHLSVAGGETAEELRAEAGY
jgi:hypothetical protein